MNRRSFLTALSSFPFLPYVINASEQGNDKACIFVYLHGGISHIETTHSLLGMPKEFAPVKGIIDTGLGFTLGGSFTGLAQRAKDLRIVRSFNHKDANHGTASGWITSAHNMLGGSETSPMKEPSYGSIVAKMLGSSNSIGVPTYVKTSQISFGARRDGSAWLGSDYIGFDIDDEGIRNLKLGVDKERGDERMRLVEYIDRKDDPLFRAWTDLRRQAYNVAMGKASEAFDLSKEPIETQNRFKLGKSEFGKSLLMAIRTIKFGSKFVNVVNSGWDNHGDIEQAFSQKGVELDWGLSLLIDELKREGLCEKTLIVVTTEFGRTPKININAGRDHWNNLIPLIFMGGGYNGGVVVGTCNDKAEFPTSRVYTPSDLAASILGHFGIDSHVKAIDNQQRPRYFVEEGTTNLLKV